MATLPRARVGGSGFTVLQWHDGAGTNLIGYCSNVVVTPVRAVAGPEVIQPINAQRPLEIVTAGAHGNGTIALTITELYNHSIWQGMATLANSQDIVDIMRTLAALDQGVVVTKIVRPGNRADNQGYYTESFYNVVVASVEDEGETIALNTLSLPKTMTLWFTHSKKSWINGGDYVWPRDTRTGFVA